MEGGLGPRISVNFPHGTGTKGTGPEVGVRGHTWAGYLRPGSPGRGEGGGLHVYVMFVIGVEKMSSKTDGYGSCYVMEICGD